MIKQKFIRLSDVQEVIGCSRTTIHRMIKDGSFPKPVTLRNRQIRFVASEVDAWMKNKIESGRKEAAASK